MNNIIVPEENIWIGFCFVPLSLFFSYYILFYVIYNHNWTDCRVVKALVGKLKVRGLSQVPFISCIFIFSFVFFFIFKHCILYMYGCNYMSTIRSWGEWLKLYASLPHVLGLTPLLPLFIITFLFFTLNSFMNFPIFFHHSNHFFFLFFDTYLLLVTLSLQFIYFSNYFPP